MNLFRIDFIQGKTDAVDYLQIKHSLVDYDGDRAIMSLTVSADKLQSVSNYAREPKRLEFECFMTDWIENNILVGTYEHERYISHFEVKAYRDDVLIFCGIIDTSTLNYNPAEGIIKFLCYDKIKLLSIYSDLEQLYTLTAGYQPAQILGYMIQKIQEKIPISMSASYAGFSVPAITISGQLELVAIDYASMTVLPPNSGGWTYSWADGCWVSPKHGYILMTSANRLIFIFAHKKIQKLTSPEETIVQYRAIYKARICHVFSGMAYKQYDYDNITGWQEEEFTSVSDSEIAFGEFFTGMFLAADIYDSLTTPVSLNSTTYAASLAGNICTAAVSGNALPPYIHPGKFYAPEGGGANEKTNCLKTLQALMMMYNATVVAAANGTIQFLSKEPGTGAAIEIDDADLVGDIDIHRINQEVPDTSALEVLYGETKLLKEICKDYLMEFHGGKWQISCTVDNLAKYALTLGATVIIRSQAYILTEVQRDYENDEYIIKGWR